MDGKRRGFDRRLLSVSCIFILLIISSQLVSRVETSNNSQEPEVDENRQFHESVVNSGSGTKEDPYIIENRIFNRKDWTTYKIVSETDDYYIIRDCQFVATTYSTVQIYNSSNCIIENCEFIKCKLTVFSSRNCIVRENTFRDLDYLGSDGLTIYYSLNCSVTSNVAYGCYTGIQVRISNNTLVSSNLVYDNIYGIELFFANSTTLLDNQLYNNGLHIRCDYLGMWARAFYWYQYVGAKLDCRDNYVNDKPLMFYQDLTTGTIDASQFGQLILQNCSGVSVRNGIFSNTTYGVQFLFCEDISIRDAIATNYSRAGIDLFHTNSSSIVNCSVIGNDWWGVHAAVCWNITVEDSYLEGNGLGLYLGGCDNCTISNNTATKNEKGFYLSYSHNSTLIGNSLRENDYGFYFYNSEQNLVINNTILYNTQYGIYLDTYSRGNRIYGNSIGWNGRYNAYSGGSNYFDDGVGIGNLWSDYDGSGIYEVYLFDEDNYPSILYPEARVLVALTACAGSVLIAIIAIGIIRLFEKRRNLKSVQSNLARSTNQLFFAVLRGVHSQDCIVSFR